LELQQQESPLTVPWQLQKQESPLTELLQLQTQEAYVVLTVLQSTVES
jgi:hypothetical protein